MIQDCKPKAVIRPTPPTKIHQMKFLPKDAPDSLEDVLAVSTEDGRIIFYAINDSAHHSTAEAKVEQPSQVMCQPFAQLGGLGANLVGRIKDFDIHALPSADGGLSYLIVTASSDGAVRLWTLTSTSLTETKTSAEQASPAEEKVETTVKQVGRLEGTRETGNRIICLTSFVMDEPVEDEDGEEEEEEFGGFSDGAAGQSDSDDE